MEEKEHLTSSELALLGENVIDIHLNDVTHWEAIPEATWNFKIGGFQVLRKWLSYRDSDVLGRALTSAEAREFGSIARRLTELVLASPELDANYREAAGMVDQDPLPEFVQQLAR
jgi:hypothetical protein